MSAAVALLLFLLTGTVVPVNRGFRQTPDGVPIYVISNGLHTDLVLPLREPRTGTNWLRQFPDSTFQARFGSYQYVAFGWGSEGFYLASYDHHFPGPGPILRALVPGPTLMHVRFFRHGLQPGKYVVPLQISEDEYRLLARRIDASFRSDSLAHYTLRNEAGYTQEDFFFRAQGHYHALRTCNDWTNQALKHAGIRAAWKAPLAGSVLYQARRAE